MLSPEEVLANAINPMAQTVNDYGQSQVNLAALQLQQAMALDAARQRAALEHANALDTLRVQHAQEDKTQAQAHKNRMEIVKEEDRLARGRNAESFDREWWGRFEMANDQHQRDLALREVDHQNRMAENEAQANAYISRLDHLDKQRMASKYAQYGYVRKPGESDEDFIKRTSMGVAERANTIYDHINAINNDVLDAMRTEKQRVEGIMQRNATAQVKPMLEKIDSGLAKLVDTGKLDINSAIEKAKLKNSTKGDALEQTYLGALASEQKNAARWFDPEVDKKIQQLTRQANQLEQSYTRIVDDKDMIGATPYLRFGAAPVTPGSVQGTGTGSKPGTFLEEAQKLFKKPEGGQPSAGTPSAAAPSDPGAVLGTGGMIGGSLPAAAPAPDSAVLNVPSNGWWSGSPFNSGAPVQSIPAPSLWELAHKMAGDRHLAIPSNPYTQYLIRTGQYPANGAAAAVTPPEVLGPPMPPTTVGPPVLPLAQPPLDLNGALINPLMGPVTLPPSQPLPPSDVLSPRLLPVY